MIRPNEEWPFDHSERSLVLLRPMDHDKRLSNWATTTIEAQSYQRLRDPALAAVFRMFAHELAFFTNFKFSNLNSTLNIWGSNSVAESRMFNSDLTSNNIIVKRRNRCAPHAVRSQSVWWLYSKYDFELSVDHSQYDFECILLLWCAWCHYRRSQYGKYSHPAYSEIMLTVFTLHAR